MTDPTRRLAEGRRIVPAAALEALMTGLFRASGLSEASARIVAGALVETDLQGLPSHGVLQGEQYLVRLKRGIVSLRERIEIVSDRGSIVVVDAHDMLGQLSSDQAMALAIERSRVHGVGVVPVRRGAHIGAASRYALMAAKAGCVGIAMGNTRSVMPAPGGVDPVVGTNPIAIGIPTAEEPDIVFDMATSEGSIGRIRILGKAGQPIPATWAVKADGTPTTDAAEALKGMLLPTGGAKGFGLSLMIDLLCGLLSSGGWGDGVIGGVEGSQPHNQSQLFIALDIAHFRPLDEFKAEASAAARRIRRSRRAPGVDRVYVPGERKWEAKRAAAGMVTLEAKQVEALVGLARDLGVDTADFLAALC